MVILILSFIDQNLLVPLDLSSMPMRLMGDPVMGWRQTLSLPSALGLLRLLRVFAAMMSTVFGGRHCHPQIKLSSSLVEGLIFDLYAFVVSM